MEMTRWTTCSVSHNPIMPLETEQWLSDSRLSCIDNDCLSIESGIRSMSISRGKREKFGKMCNEFVEQETSFMTADYPRSFNSELLPLKIIADHENRCRCTSKSVIPTRLYICLQSEAFQKTILSCGSSTTAEMMYYKP
jgi:hypothetical protein